MSKLVTLKDDGTVDTIADATFMDILASALKPNQALTGMYKYGQMAVAGLAGAVIVNKRHSGEYFNFGR